MSQSLRSLRVVPTRVPSRSPEDRADVSIYRRFFLAGMACVLTVGCLLGATALFGISRQGDYTANAWTPFVLAHANSQLFGWVGFFVMGFALQQHPPTEGKKRLFLKLAGLSLSLMAIGIAVRFVAEPLVRLDRALWLPIGVAACLSQTLAVVLFLANTQITRHRSGEPLRWPSKFVFASLFWFLAVAIAEPAVFAMSHQADPTNSILFVAKWFAPLREAQFLGFAAMMIFGVSLTKLGTCFGWKPAHRTLGEIGLALWTLGLLARIVGWNRYFAAELAPGTGTLYQVGGVLIACAAVSLLASSRLFERPEHAARSHKFVRGAYGWLVAAGVLMVLEPMHLAAIGQPFSHAFTGAIRHAFTVGFISQMIVGVSMHVVARMHGMAEERLAGLWSVFILLNLGNAARVALEILTDYRATAFAPMGWTGFVELVALGIWAAHVGGPLVRTNLRRRAYAC
ncbi:MAG: hypothetical protein KIS66_14465 [Fimbriimonadaceae bacterium]|nr:hypothetical protein [Fimbriimonadaceae bacterium]